MVAIVLDHNFFNHDAQAGGFFPKTHINPGFDIDSLIKTNGKNILIEGIRGTGKTHILKMIASKCIDNYVEFRILPVYISLNMVSEWQGSDIRLFRIQLYANIVSKTIETIEKNKTNIGYDKSGTKKAIDVIKNMFGGSVANFL
jgi:Cdc6-like AAA superfamily ATPase